MGIRLGLLALAGVGLLSALGCSEGEQGVAPSTTSSDASTETTDPATPTGKTFRGAGYSFTYPANWEEAEEVYDPSESGVDYAGVGNPLAPSANLLTIGVGQSDGSVTEANFGEVEADTTAQLRRTFFPARIDGPARLTVGLDDLLALSYESEGTTESGQRVLARVFYIFDGMTHYAMNCQSTPAWADEMKRGCDQVLDSFQVD